jgi:hypothetical protein
MKSKTRSPNSAYYRNKADEIFMVQFRGLPCEVCGTTNMTVGHHNVSKARSKALRYDKRNITALCQAHHTMGNDICPHSSNPMAVDRYFDWFRNNEDGKYYWLVENERIERKYSYRQALENLKNGRDAWV